MNGGLVLGRNQKEIFYVKDDIHSLCIGATRCGKTRHVVLPTVGLLGLAGESMILSDPKGELYNFTSEFLRKQGYEIIAIDFKNPKKSDRYNFLQQVIDAVDAEDINNAIDATWDITSQLVGESKGERIWTDGEASMIAASIMAVVYENRKGVRKKFQNLTNVYEFILGMTSPDAKGKIKLTEFVESLDTNHPARSLLGSSKVAPARTRGSFYTSALMTLKHFTISSIYNITKESSFVPADIGRKKVALFIILPDEKKTYHTLASLMVNSIYMELCKEADKKGGRLDRRVNYVLDEFGNFSTIPDFDTKLTVGGGRRIRFNLFLQNFSQLEKCYGKETAQIIKGNCENWIYLQSQDIETQKEISEKLGKYTTSTYSLSSSYSKNQTPSGSHSTNLTARCLLEPGEVGKINRPYNLVLSRSDPAIFYAPDFSKWEFNNAFGMGDVEHNKNLRIKREAERKEIEIERIELWNVWNFHSFELEEEEDDVFED